MIKGAKREAGAVDRQALVDQIVKHLAHRHSTAAVLFHHALAERLELGPTDHKCLDVLRERGPMSGAELASITRLTSGAVTGVVARLEKAGFVHRAADPHDGRKQVLSVAHDRVHELHEVFRPLHEEVAAVLEQFDTGQLTAIAQFLTRTTDIVYRHIGLLRTRALSPSSKTAHR